MLLTRMLDFLAAAPAHSRDTLSPAGSLVKVVQGKEAARGRVKLAYDRQASSAHADEPHDKIQSGTPGQYAYRSPLC